MAAGGTRIKLSAVIACYRDAPAVPMMYERLKKTFEKIGVDYEIIFVNDASPDNAKEVLAELAAQDLKVCVINHSRNFGSQSAFTSGMRIATGDAVVLLDGDLQDPPEIIESFFHKWREGYDVVYGIRHKRLPQDHRSPSNTHSFTGKIFHCLVRVIHLQSHHLVAGVP